MDTVTISARVWEDMQSALAKCVHYLTMPLSTPLDVLAVAQVADKIAAEDATFEGLTEFSDRTPIPFMLAPRIFERGDIIPDDVKMLELNSEESKSYQYIDLKANGNYGYLHTRHGWGTPDTAQGMWEWSDFPLTEVVGKVLFTPDEAAAHLRHHGISIITSQLYYYLNNSICWTDGLGAARGCASTFLVDTTTDYATPSFGVTAAGLSELVRVMKVTV